MSNNQYLNANLIEESQKISEAFIAKNRSNHHRDKFFPNIINELNLKIGVEVGTDKGGFAERILAKSNISELHCVDPWIDDFGSNYRPGFFDKNGSNRMKEAQEKLDQYMQSQRCYLHQGFSADIAATWEKPIDFLYIDGDHSLEGIYTDLYSWVPKVKVGGIISGHDYKDGPGSGIKDFFGNQLPYKVKTVVDNFCKQYGFKLNPVGGRILSWWFVKNH